MGKKGFDFRCGHVLGVAFVMEEYEPFDPMDVSVFRAQAVMFDADFSRT